MKKQYASIAALIISGLSSLQAQVLKKDSILMGAGYANEIFYDMATGQKGSSAVTNWDIAHTTVQMDNCIRANHMTGLQVMHYPKNTTWANFDTAGWKTWGKNWNDMHVHEKGAFNLFQNLPVWRFGWGVYDNNTHEVTGDSMFLLAWFNGAAYVKFLKFMPIKQPVNGNLIFKYANVDGSGEVMDTLYQSAANNQNYKYYAFAGKTKTVREPNKASWDIAFSRYYEPTYDPGSGTYIPYPVMGVTSNRGTLAVKLRGPSFASVLADTHNLVRDNYKKLKNDLTAIGSNWKVFNQSTSKYELKDTQSYIIKSVRTDTNYWLIHFTGYGGGANGKVVFTYYKLGSTLAVTHPLFGTVKVFPNPAKDQIYVTFENSKIDNFNVNLSNISGSIVRSVQVDNAQSFGAATIPINGMTPGIYLLNLQSKNNSFTQKIVIE